MSKRTAIGPPPTVEVAGVTFDWQLDGVGVSIFMDGVELDYETLATDQEPESLAYELALAWVNDGGLLGSVTPRPRDSRRRTAADESGATCSVCGASIERDPEGEEPRTWHHNDGDKHDHEAKPSGGDKESRRRVVRMTAATGSELRAQHSDLFSGADAAYDAEDSSWFESLSMDDLLILWDSVSGNNFIDMEGPWDDEVYDALADKGYEFPTKESRKRSAIDYPTDDDDSLDAADFGGGDFPMQTPTSPPQSEQEGRGTLIDPNDAEYSPVTGQPGRYYTPDRDMTVGVGTRPGARRGLNDTGGGGGGSSDDDEGLQEFPGEGEGLYSVQPNDPEPEQLEPSTDRPFEEGGYLAPVADYLNKFRQVPASKRTAATEFEVQGNYGYGDGWEVLTTEDTKEEAQERLREYNENEPGTPHRVKRVTASRTAADDDSGGGGQTCSVCGASIERDPPGEDPRTWHHNDGESHDHEAKPSGGDKESRRTAVASDVCPKCGEHMDDVTVSGDTLRAKCASCGWSGTKRKKSSMRKGAPFADYKDFADCVAKNSDKDDPEAYCGYIKHKVEDKKSSKMAAEDPQPPKITPNPDGPKTVQNGWIRMKGKDEPEYNPEVAQLIVDMNHWDRLTFQDMNLGSRIAEHKTEGPYKVQVAGSGENVWSENALRFDTPEEAKSYASDLLGRWFGADMARVVSSDTPTRAAVDTSDPQIVINYRTGMRRRAMREISVHELRSGDILIGPDGGIDRTNNRVAKVDGFSGMWVIDFTNGTSTPPLGNGKVTVVREGVNPRVAAKYRGDFDRSAAFTVLLDVWPEFGSSPDDGGKTVTAFLNDWYEDPGTDMYAFAKGWVAGKTARLAVKSNACENGNHSTCTASSCTCSCHKKGTTKDMSGACGEGDHDACQMSHGLGEDDCQCPVCRRKTATRKQSGPEGWWPLTPGQRHPGENELTCPACGSQSVVISGSNLGSDVVRNNLYTSLECQDCGNRKVFPMKMDRDGNFTYAMRHQAGEILFDASDGTSWFYTGLVGVPPDEVLPDGSKIFYNAMGGVILRPDGTLEAYDGPGGADVIAPGLASRHAARSLSEIASEIRRDWKNVEYSAVPYLDAMRQLDTINDNYGADSAKSIVAYFLVNASKWRGETAKRIKAELRAMGSKTAADNDEEEGAHTVRDPRNPRGLYGGDRNILLQDRALELADEEKREQLELRQLERAGARSDYAHWNEDADYMWYQEEGRFPEEPPEPDDYDERYFPEDDEEEEEDEDEDDWVHGGDITPQQERAQMGITGSREGLFGFGDPDKWGPVKWVPGTPIEDATPVDIWDEEHDKESSLLVHQAMDQDDYDMVVAHFMGQHVTVRGGFEEGITGTVTGHRWRAPNPYGGGFGSHPVFEVTTDGGDVIGGISGDALEVT